MINPVKTLITPNSTTFRLYNIDGEILFPRKDLLEALGYCSASFNKNVKISSIFKDSKTMDIQLTKRASPAKMLFLEEFKRIFPTLKGLREGFFTMKHSAVLTYFCDWFEKNFLQEKDFELVPEVKKVTQKNLPKPSKPIYGEIEVLDEEIPAEPIVKRVEIPLPYHELRRLFIQSQKKIDELQEENSKLKEEKDAPEEKEPTEIFRERLEGELQRRGKSPLDLSKQAGLDNSIIYRILNYKNKASLNTAAKIAKTLGASLDWLCGLRSDRDV